MGGSHEESLRRRRHRCLRSCPGRATDRECGSIRRLESYAAANLDGTRVVRTGSQFVGQSFTAADGWIDSVTLYLVKTGNPSGNATVRLYSHTGTFGTSSRPGTVLATSSSVPLSNITATGSTLQAVNFTFPTPVQLVGGQNYVFAIDSGNGDTSNYIAARTDVTAPTHPGNPTYSASGSTWTVQTIVDVGFIVYETPLDTTGPVITTNVSEGASYPTPRRSASRRTTRSRGPSRQRRPSTATRAPAVPAFRPLAATHW